MRSLSANTTFEKRSKLKKMDLSPDFTHSGWKNRRIFTPPPVFGCGHLHSSWALKMQAGNDRHRTRLGSDGTISKQNAWRVQHCNGHQYILGTWDFRGLFWLLRCAMFGPWLGKSSLQRRFLHIDTTASWDQNHQWLEEASYPLLFAAINSSIM